MQAEPLRWGGHGDSRPDDLSQLDPGHPALPPPHLPDLLEHLFRHLGVAEVTPLVLPVDVAVPVRTPLGVPIRRQEPVLAREGVRSEEGAEGDGGIEARDDVAGEGFDPGGGRGVDGGDDEADIWRVKVIRALVVGTVRLGRRGWMRRVRTPSTRRTP